MPDRFDRERKYDRDRWSAGHDYDDREYQERRGYADRGYEPAWDRAREAYERDRDRREEERYYGEERRGRGWFSRAVESLRDAVGGEERDDRDRYRYEDRSSSSYGGGMLTAGSPGAAIGGYGPVSHRSPGNYAGKGPRSYRRSDARITEDVCRRLTDDPYVDASEIIIRVEGGVVTLTGTVHDRQGRHQAEDTVSDIWGVQDVRNELRVRPQVGTNRIGTAESGASDTAGTPVRQP